jgi:hypothetical protein
VAGSCSSEKGERFLRVRISLAALCSNFDGVRWERSGDGDIMSCISLPLPEEVPDLVWRKAFPSSCSFLAILCLRWCCGEEGREWIRI